MSTVWGWQLGQLGEYQIDDRILGSGGTSTVRKAWKLGDQFAIKMYNAPDLRSGLLRSFFEKEVAALTALSHPNIVRIIDHGYSDEDAAHFVVLEWLPETLSEHLDAHDSGETPLRWWDSFMPQLGIPILKGLVFAHERGIAHRDIKPTNLLVGDTGIPKLADFGIARVATETVTVSEFRSAAYAPPEAHRDEQSDLFSLGLTFVELLSGVDWDHSERDRSVRVGKAIQNLDVHPKATNFLTRMVAEDRTVRFRTAAQALSFLETHQATRYTVDTPHSLKVHVGVTNNAGQRLGNILDLHRRDQWEAAITSDLKSMRAEQYDSDSGGLRYRLYGSEFAYLAVRPEDDPSSVLLLVDAWPITAFDLDAAEGAAAFPGANVSAKRPDDHVEARRALQAFAGEVARHHAQIEADSRHNFEKGRLAEWDVILTAREDLERRREEPLEYVQFEEIEDGRVVYTLDKPAEEADVVGQTRTVPGRSRYEGVVEGVDGKTIVLRTTSGSVQGLDQRGRLKVDRWLSQLAIRRERNALETVRNQRSVRPDLRDLLSDPSTARPAVAGVVSFVDGDLDEPKQHIVSLANGPADLLAVEGPPGTGKTRLIAELVVQEALKGHRTLLTAQSHAAVDNALERLDGLTMSIVRVGRRESISDEIFRRYHIDGALATWFAEVSSNSEQGLATWADAHQIDDRVRALLGYGYDLARSESELSLIDERASAAGELEAILQMAFEDPSSSPIVDLDDNLILTAGIDPDELEARALPDTVERLQLVRGHFETLVERDSKIRSRNLSLCEKASAIAGTVIRSSADLRAKAEAVGQTSEADLKKFERLSEIRSGWLARFGSNAEFRTLLLASADVVAGTCVGIASVAEIMETDFDRVIIDEASKASPTETLVPMVLGRSWIVVGDTHQLPPYVDTDLVDETPELDRERLEQTIFQQLLDGLPAENTAILSTQHRMIAPIGDLISDCFYGGVIESPRTVTEMKTIAQVFDPPVKWLSTSRLSKRRESRRGTSFSNAREIEVISRYLKDLDRVAVEYGEAPTVAVLCGYSAQRFALRRRFSAVSFEAIGVDVHSVDEFQGQERDVAIYSTVRSNDKGTIGFLSSTERLNVALSRGRDALVIVGDLDHMLGATTVSNPFVDVIRYIQDSQLHAAVTDLEYE
ncbi:MAG: AAA domain-containing protein [Acidimicrobiia bacterium]|nr:AAA domain-containing protein [Acidimicrobiia bacterium]